MLFLHSVRKKATKENFYLFGFAQFMWKSFLLYICHSLKAEWKAEMMGRTEKVFSCFANQVSRRERRKIKTHSIRVLILSTPTAFSFFVAQKFPSGNFLVRHSRERKSFALLLEVKQIWKEIKLTLGGKEHFFAVKSSSEVYVIEVFIVSSWSSVFQETSQDASCFATSASVEQHKRLSAMGGGRRKNKFFSSRKDHKTFQLNHAIFAPPPFNIPSERDGRKGGGKEKISI